MSLVGGAERYPVPHGKTPRGAESSISAADDLVSPNVRFWKSSSACYVAFVSRLVYHPGASQYDTLEPTWRRIARASSFAMHYSGIAPATMIDQFAGHPTRRHTRNNVPKPYLHTTSSRTTSLHSLHRWVSFGRWA